MFDYEALFAGKKVCYNCVHYTQHYRRNKRGYSPVGWGHCVTPRVKARKPEQGCKYWAEKSLGGHS